MSGGLVHYVYKVTKGDQIFYLKIRGNRFSKIPSVECNPNDIQYEQKAIGILSAVTPNVFPRIIASNSNEGIILMTSIMSESDNLQTMLQKGNISKDSFYLIGKTFGNIHGNLFPYKEGIRNDGDQQYYSNNLQYRLGFYGHKTLDDVVTELKLHSQWKCTTC